MTESDVHPPEVALQVTVGAEDHLFDPGAGIVTVGRDPESTICIPDGRVSATHLRIEWGLSGWRVTNVGRNGMFIDGLPADTVLLERPTGVHLAERDGVAVTLTPVDSAVTDVPATLASDADLDAGVLRAGRAVATRRRELEMSQRGLARDNVASVGTLVAFEKGRTWPRRATLSRLEQALGWSPGTITGIRNGATGASASIPGPAADHRPQSGVAPSGTVSAPLMVETVELALNAITAAITALPPRTDPAFAARAEDVLADLRRLAKVAAGVATEAPQVPSIFFALSGIRRAYLDLVTVSASSPTAPLGHRLYLARHRAQLSPSEASGAAGLPVDTVTDIEAGQPVAAAAAAKAEALITALARR